MPVSGLGMLNGKEKGTDLRRPLPFSPPSLLLVTQRPDVRRDLIDLIVRDVGATSRRHGNSALRLLLSHTFLDIGGDAGIAAVAMKPSVTHQIRGRLQHPFCVLTVAGVAI